MSSVPEQQPVAFQLFNDEAAQLWNYVLITDKDSTRKATRLDKDGKPVTLDFFKELGSSDSKCQSSDPISKNKISSLHASAVIDLNMDCRPDLWVESTNAQGQRVVEMYFLQDDGKFCLVASPAMASSGLKPLNPLKSSSFSFFDLLRKGNNSALFMDDNSKLHMMNNLYNIPNPSNAASPLCTKTERLNETSKKHVPPFEGFDKLGSQFTEVVGAFSFLTRLELLFPGRGRAVRRPIGELLPEQPGEQTGAELPQARRR